MRVRILALAAGMAIGLAGHTQAAPGSAWYRCQEAVYAESAIAATVNPPPTGTT